MYIYIFIYRLLIDLISTLDDFFPDYDFHSTKPEQFLKKDVTHLIQLVNSYLAGTYVYI
jgi:hypothetical protein